MKHPKAPPLDKDAFQKITGTDDAAVARLETYAGTLFAWQKKMNLVAASTLDDVWRRHMLDSAQLKNFLRPTDRTILDLGSGAGFPGLVLAILTPCTVHLVESNGRKCAFLREVARKTGANAVVHDSRIEALEAFPVDVVTSRALAPVGRLLAYSAPFLAENSRCLFLKGINSEQELTESRKDWKMIVTKAESLSDPSGVVLTIEGAMRRHD